MTIRVSAEDCARALGQAHLPTPEQTAVIEAPLTPQLVVAGAGSGKTETMAARVVWLIANDMVAPEEVLGLTFTRKAAGELAERLATRLGTVRAAGLWRPDARAGSPALGQLPVVSTYHSYAGRIVREHGARLGVEADSRLLTEAAAWQFAHVAVTAHDGPMEGVVKAESTVTTAVIDLSGEMAEHLVDVPALEAHLADVTGALESLVKGEGSRRRGLPTEIRTVVEQLTERRAILPLLTAYAALKRERSAMDFADQMALAARLARSFPQVGAEERARFKVVLLDEFQDTSEAQLQLLRSLFAPGGQGWAVTAVGDPHQSIYGWRGASSTTLQQFVSDFAGAEPVTVRPLSTSWRNDRTILAAANVVSGPLRAQSRVPVRPLGARADAGRGHLDVARLGTLEEEARHVVEWLVERRRRPGRHTAAILCRKRSQFDPIIDALEARGIPHEVVGLGGLLHTPEVADLVALLWTVQDPSRGDQLMRLLTGARCRLGAADLDGLAAWARELARRHRAPRAGSRRQEAPVDLDPEAAAEASLVEALDRLPPPGWRGPAGEHVGSTAMARLEGLAQAVRHLRTRTGLGLADLVVEAEAALGLDVEVLSRPHWSIGTARAHLDAFEEVAATFDAATDRPSLGGFLSWLAAAVAEERGLDLGWIETSPDAVQVMTVHAAKGLEWDVVAVPGLVEGGFPVHSATRTTPGADGWTHHPPTDKAWLGGLTGLPHDLRGDRAGLPRFPWDHLREWDEAADAFRGFQQAAADHGIAEERRLMYVAVTRARRDLLLTAHVWGTARTPRVTSRFLDEIRAGDLADRATPWADLPPTDPAPENPRLVDEEVVPWPPAPARDRLEQWRHAADLVRDAGPEETTDTSVPVPGRDWQDEAALLLAERDAVSRVRDVELPPHVSTSDLVSLATDPRAHALALRRPMPQPPRDDARAGTALHAWIEQHYARASFLDPADLPGADDDPTEPRGHGGADLALLKANFRASAWAALDPLELEVAVETMIAGVSVRGRIDAVFADPDRPGGYVVVDWKSGPPPRRDPGPRAIQLASYRVAWCRLRGVDPALVRGAFFHAATGETIWPDLPGLPELEALLRLPTRGV